MIEVETEPKLPESIRQKKLNKKGINLNILLIGENGIGKKSFINTLCKGDYFSKSEEEETDFKLENTVINFQEPGSIPIKLHVTVTKNYGFNLENLRNGDDLVQYLEREFQVMLEEEIKIDRNPHIEDNRVHVALYFVRCTGRGLNELDIETMKKLGSKVNLIPVLSKADALTDEEVEVNRALVNESIGKHGIETYDFLSDLFEDYDVEALHKLQERFPFTIISSNTKDYQRRSTKWGTIDIENADICDFSVLKNILFGSHLEEFKESTVDSKYEKFRCQKLTR